jgi:hypothetical protein
LEYGIRRTPGGPLDDVTVKDAVELCLYSGKKVRIGTDEPEILVGGIDRVSTGRRQHDTR